jgi:hypothetical protein
MIWSSVNRLRFIRPSPLSGADYTQSSKVVRSASRSRDRNHS